VAGWGDVARVMFVLLCRYISNGISHNKVGLIALYLYTLLLEVIVMFKISMLLRNEGVISDKSSNTGSVKTSEY
jgi:hypothetical protein